jgi:predicted unusual protein kinase regulating ubiquinone biosynthesis (AarF/ABC1/UbiB family)
VTDLKQHFAARGSASNLLTSRFSKHPERHVQIFQVFRKYELHHIVAELGMSHQHDEDPELLELEHDDDHGRQLACALEELGPCFIKLGHLLSTRPDLLPADYLQALSRLQDTVQPVPPERIVQIVQTELHAPIDDLFQEFDEQPLATALMAQVHRAVLRDGTEVAVKVQRPGVRQCIEIDLEVLREIAQFAGRHTAFGARYRLVEMVHELDISLSQELDFRIEAENTRRIGRQIAGFSRLCTPSVLPEYTSSRVLTLSFLHGRHLADVPPEEMQAHDPNGIASDLLETYLDMIQQPPDLDQHGFTQDISALVSRYHDMSGGRLGLGSALLNLTRLAYQNRVPVPSAMTLLGKKHLFENAPRRTDTILAKLADDWLMVRLDVEHLQESTASLNRAASRLAMGVLAGSLLIGGGQVLSALIQSGAVGKRRNGMS